MSFVHFASLYYATTICHAAGLKPLFNWSLFSLTFFRVLTSIFSSSASYFMTSFFAFLSAMSLSSRGHWAVQIWVARNSISNLKNWSEQFFILAVFSWFRGVVSDEKVSDRTHFVSHAIMHNRARSWSQIWQEYLARFCHPNGPLVHKIPTVLQ